MIKRRSTFVINRRFQLRFAFFVSSWVVALALVFPWILYSFIETFSNMIAKHADGNVLVSIQNFQSESIFAIAVGMVVFSLVIFLLSLYMSHRVAGPVYRIQSALARWTKGAVEQNIHLRKHDHFLELSDSYNQAAKQHADLIQKTKYARDRLDSLSAELDARHKAIVSEIVSELQWPGSKS
jgi:methyl-accepting chemotaxis protein